MGGIGFRRLFPWAGGALLLSAAAFLGAQEEDLVFPGQVLLIPPPSRNEIIAAVPEPELVLPEGVLPEPDWGRLPVPEEAREPSWEPSREDAAQEPDVPVGLDVRLGGGSRLHLLTGFSLYQYSGEDRFRLSGDYESYSGYWNGSSWGDGKRDHGQSVSLEGEGAFWKAAYRMERRGYQGLNPGRRDQDIHSAEGEVRREISDSGIEGVLQGGWQGLYIRGGREDYDQGVWLRPGLDGSMPAAGGVLSAFGEIQPDLRKGDDEEDAVRIPGLLGGGWRSSEEGVWHFSVQGGAGAVLGRRWGLPWHAEAAWTPDLDFSVRMNGGYRWEILPVLGAPFPAVGRASGAGEAAAGRLAPYTLYPEEDRTLEAWAGGLAGSWRLGGGFSLEATENLYLWERRPVLIWDGTEGMWRPGEASEAGVGTRLAGFPWSWQNRLEGRWSRWEESELLLSWTSRLGADWAGLPDQEIAGEMRWRTELPGETSGGLSGEGSWVWYGKGDPGNDWPLVSLGAWWNPDPAVEVRLDTEDWLSLADVNGRTWRGVYQEPGFRATLRVQISL